MFQSIARTVTIRQHLYNSPILQAKESERNYFLRCPGITKIDADLPFANRVVLMAVWLRNQTEIPDEMRTIGEERA